MVEKFDHKNKLYSQLNEYQFYFKKKKKIPRTLKPMSNNSNQDITI